jgi:hypothetical protein
MKSTTSAVSSTTWTKARESSRDIKYAVLHLQAAAEVLLKARLFREHWDLVFNDPGKATPRRSGI